MPFEPIAIIGQSCVLPGALTPGELWNRIAAGEDLITRAPDGYWRTDPNLVMADFRPDSKDTTWCDRGGYVQGFEAVFNPDGFAIPKQEIMKFSRPVHWLLHACREALQDAGYWEAPHLDAGLIIGNLSYPSSAMSAFAESIWLDAQPKEFMAGMARSLAKVSKPHAINRFMSGLPAHIAAQALGLRKGAFALDAACASSLFAVRLACDRLHDRKADLMLAGGVQGSDDLIIHIGFCTLQAMSKTGQSRPFNKNADGLIPAEGAGIIVLKRLSDAVRAGDRVYAVIRGIGLSNDGRGQGLLVPSAEGQVRAMESAYRMSGIQPAQISLIECHATGTKVGDDVEIESTRRIFKGLSGIPIGSIKSNMGHPITASGIAGIIKITGAMKAKMRPATLHVEEPSEKLKNTPFRLLQEIEDWPSKTPRLAAVSNFGFGGNNAHLILEEWDGRSPKKNTKYQGLKKTKIAVVGIGVVAAFTGGREEFAKAVFSGKNVLKNTDVDSPMGKADCFELPLTGLRFFPAALEQTLPQQLLMLKAATESIERIKNLDAERTGVFVGMGCDGEVARSGICWRLPQFVCDWLHIKSLDQNAREWIESVKNTIHPGREASTILGAMPNVAANRINSQFDLKGQSLTVSSEELSGIRALELALRALKAEEINAAIVGAVDISCEPVHMAAAEKVLDRCRQTPGDAAIALVLKREEDARKSKDTIYALFSDEPFDKVDLELSIEDETQSVTPIIGHAHAASGLLHVAAAVLACRYRARPTTPGSLSIPWLSEKGRSARVKIHALGGQSSVITVEEDPKSRPGHLCIDTLPALHVYSGRDLPEVLRNLHAGAESDNGPGRLVIVAQSPLQLEGLKKKAGELLGRGENAKRLFNEEGIYFCAHPHEGEVAFVFAGAGAAYPDMGKPLYLAFPELFDEIMSRFNLSATDIAENLPSLIPNSPLTPEGMLWESSFLCQFHAIISQTYLGLKPHAAIGFSAGETNALFAMGAWKDMGGILSALKKNRVYTHEIGGAFHVVQQAWRWGPNKKPKWGNWGILAPEARVQEAIAAEPLVHITLINAPDHVVISGESSACDRVIDKIGRHRAYPLNFDIAIHCPEILVYADQWLKLHTLPTARVPGVRFYTSSTSTYYHPTREKAAQAILGMASQVVNFPLMIQNAWNDGVRIFIEHGPQNRCAQWIDQILGDKPHLAVSLDRRERSPLVQLFHAAAGLKAAGIRINDQALYNLLSPSQKNKDKSRQGLVKPTPTKTYRVHPPPILLPPLPENKNIGEPLSGSADSPEAKSDGPSATIQVMAPAPWLPPVMEEYEGPGEEREISPAAVDILKRIEAQTAMVAELHQDFLRRHSEVHRYYLDCCQSLLSRIARMPGSKTLSSAQDLSPSASHKPPSSSPVGSLPPKVVPPTPGPRPDPMKAQFENAVSIPPTGPRFSKQQLEILASGRISEVFGEMFKIQDDYPRQVRLPEYPLLLADRITGLDAKPGSMGKGIIWTETDVTPGAWYLHDIHMPAGITVESGQCDLALISYLGADFQNKGKRVYRLLGCDLMYYGNLPRVGDTLCYQIHVDGYATIGETRIFFFRYDCRINGELRLSVRNAQAGFFSDEELAASSGILWNPETADHKPDGEAVVAPPYVACTRHEFSAEQVKAFSEERVYECFGPGFEIAQTHSKTPKIQSGMMRLIDRVTRFDPRGGPWGRGYLRVENQIDPKAWYLTCHFKNDPCMPGTLMSEACLQALSFYLAAMGYTLKRDGWRFEPVPHEVVSVKCRGQVTPKSKLLVYEVFVEELEIAKGLYPTLYADVLATCDGLKILHIRRAGIRLFPGWPLDCQPDLLDGHEEKGPVAKIGDMAFGYRSLLACAFGKPSEAFGEMAKKYDEGYHIPRLPGPPYHFMSRVSRIEAEMEALKPGQAIEVMYDVPPDAWYFKENSCPTVPFCVLMEVGLQPCGWLAVFSGGPNASDQPLFFRNLDGTGTMTREVIPSSSRLTTRTTLTHVSRISGVVLVSFDVEVFSEKTPVFSMKTGFGFFPEQALAQQVGLGATEEEVKWLDEPHSFFVDLTTKPQKYFGGKIRLPGPMLLMIDRITGYWKNGGEKALGRIRAEKTVDPGEWFFKAHFFHDPVQPGSLGVEGIIQTLQFYMIHEGMHKGLKNPRFEPVALNHAVTWKYRGQVTPDKKRILIEMDITDRGKDASGVYAIANAWLWADNLRIFNVKNLRVNMVEDLRIKGKNRRP